MSGLLVSCNVGRPREVALGDRIVSTAIFKEQVAGRVAVSATNLAGDQQADLTVHGGRDKAVYLYPAEHYPYWNGELGERLTYGMFGENLTTEGLTEESVRVGEQFRIGSVVLQVTQPRMPCYKLGIRFGRDDMVARFWASRRSGFYLAIVTPGELGAGDAIELVAAAPDSVTIAEAVRLYTGDISDDAILRQALQSPLPEGWKKKVVARRGQGA